MLASSHEVLEAVAEKVQGEIKAPFSAVDVLGVIVDVFEKLSLPMDGDQDLSLSAFVNLYQASKDIANHSHRRTQLSSQLVNEGVEAVSVELNKEFPMLSIAKLSTVARTKVEVLKQYTYVTTIFSSRVSLPEFRGYEVVKGIFDALSSKRGYLLMPADVRSAHNACNGDLYSQMRIVCDFVAGMTDRYAMEFYGRLHSENAQSLFKPL
jgi:dGTPase